jgi:prolyl-tRNA synthetase
MAAAIEQHHDADGIIWPIALCPYEVLIVTAGKEPELHEAAARLHDELSARGVEVVLDDRDERPGLKFKDADLIGIPLRVTVGRKGLAEGKLEVKERRKKEVEWIPASEVARELLARLELGRRGGMA